MSLFISSPSWGQEALPMDPVLAFVEGMLSASGLCFCVDSVHVSVVLGFTVSRR